MYNPEIYLFIARDGRELASNSHPQRAVPYIIEHVPEKANTSRYWKRSREQVLEDYLKSDEPGWFTSIRDIDYGDYVPGDIRDIDYGDYVPGEYFEFEYVELPFGTIKKLTGSELTYNDEPLKIGGDGEKS